MNIVNKRIELEIEIKLLEYLKTNKIIDPEMYSYLVNKINNKLVI
jgi:hypothetical protein